MQTKNDHESEINSEKNRTHSRTIRLEKDCAMSMEQGLAESFERLGLNRNVP